MQDGCAAERGKLLLSEKDLINPRSAIRRECREGI